MAVEIKVGPPQLAIHHGQSVLVTEPDGSIPWPSDKGLYVQDTRLISNWSVYANGAAFELLSSGPPAHDLARIFLTNPEFDTEDGKVAARVLDFTLTRHIQDGIHEDIDLSNHSRGTLRFNLEIALRCDFADIFEVRNNRIVRRGRITSSWDEAAQILETTYHNRDFRRALRIEVQQAAAVYANGRLSFGVTIPPGGHWHACVLYHVVKDGVQLELPRECVNAGAALHSPDGVLAWRAQVMKLASSNTRFQGLYAQAVDDMAALRLPLAGTDHLQFVAAAGLPWYMTLFGRDSLIVALQNILVWPGFAAGALDMLGKYQALEDDAWRDAEPGKIPHELRNGELAHLHLIPHTPYYGTADATPLYLIVLHAAWRATGQCELLDRYLPHAERCLTWIDESGDRDGDGFQEYATRSPVGYENMGWKDSGDSIVHEDGSLAQGPKALCELQGYVFDAWRRMAEIYDALDRPQDAARLRDKAQRLFIRFNEAFWDEELGFYALALDGEKRRVRSVTSNVGHCLWSGLMPQDRAARVVKRFMQPDMWSGWGIRTLSATHPAFNPNSYHCGSVWPHDNGLIALGFRRYGFAAEAAEIARCIAEAGSYFALQQLPELYAGIQRDEVSFPVQYVGANVPQAWAAGSVFSLLHALLGVRPDAPGNALYLDPHLPDWLPDLRVTDLRLNGESFDLRFRRSGSQTITEVLRGPADVVRLRPFTA